MYVRELLKRQLFENFFNRTLISAVLFHTHETTFVFPIKFPIYLMTVVAACVNP